MLNWLTKFWGEVGLVSGEGTGNPLQYSCLENPMCRGPWWAAVHGVAKSWTQLSDFTFAFHFHALEKEMATCCSILAGRIPGTAKPGGLPSMGSHRVRHDWNDLAAAAAGLVSNYLPQDITCSVRKKVTTLENSADIHLVKCLSQT